MSIIYGRIRIALQSRRCIAGLCRFQRVGFSVVVLGFSATLAAAEPASRVFNIEAKPATQSLIDYARQAHTQLGYDVDMVDAILTNAVVGQYDPAEALELLLENTGLTAEYGERGVFIRRVATREVSGDIQGRTPAVAETKSLRFAPTLARGMQPTMNQNQTSRRTESENGEDERKRPLEEIIVTGTNIRGIAPESSPIRMFTREDIQRSGAATAQDFIQTLTTNFGGGSNDDIPLGLPDDNSSTSNNGFEGTLGASVNLRGLGSGSTLVLVNGRRLAPSSGIGDFVDISMIPASAIDRVEVLTDGASSIYGADAIAGVVNFVLRDDFEGLQTSYRYGMVTEGARDEHRANIAGGVDWNTGNALIVYEYLDQGNLSAADRDFSHGADLPHDLLQATERHSFLATMSQELSKDIQVSTDLLYSSRDSQRDFKDSLGEASKLSPTSEHVGIGTDVDWKVSDTWYVDLSGSISQLDNESVALSDRREHIRTVDSDIWTVDTKASGSIVPLPGGHVKLAVGGHYREEDFLNVDVSDSVVERDAQRSVFAFYGEVSIPVVSEHNEVPGIKRLELNASGRFEDYSDFGSTTNPKVGIFWSPLNALGLRGSYSTSFNPPALGRVGASDFTASVFRTSFLNGIFGLTPGDPSIADVVVINLSGTGRSLEPETSRAFSAGFDYDNQWGGGHSVSASVTWFDIQFEDRFGRTPVPENRSFFDVPNIAFNSPDLFPAGTVIFDPSQAQILSALEDNDIFIAPFGDDPLDAEIISFAGLVRNLARTEVEGLDFHIRYAIETARDNYSFGVDGSFLQHLELQAATTTPPVDQVDTLFNPIDFRLRGHAGYSRGGFAAQFLLNYWDSYRVDSTEDPDPIDSWTTFDINLSFDTGENTTLPILENLVFRISALNVFDTNPPSTPSAPRFGIFGYDPTNATPLNRFIALEINKGWF